jgi:GrpB-like predicted nucleotidyltransferase (UPF0157 family)
MGDRAASLKRAISWLCRVSAAIVESAGTSEPETERWTMGQIVVVDYDPSWPERFTALRVPLVQALAELPIAIEHVGSTAVPGLAAKPVIDIDVIVLEHHVDEAIGRLEKLGYAHLGDCGIPGREAFRRPPGAIAHHLYVCPSTSHALANHLTVRDHLRANPADARAYGELKKRLAIDFADDADGYVEAKTAFLVGILERHGFSPDVLRRIEQDNRAASAAVPPHESTATSRKLPG